MSAALPAAVRLFRLRIVDLIKTAAALLHQLRNMCQFFAKKIGSSQFRRCGSKISVYKRPDQSVVAKRLFNGRNPIKGRPDGNQSVSADFHMIQDPLCPFPVAETKQNRKRKTTALLRRIHPSIRIHKISISSLFLQPQKTVHRRLHRRRFLPISRTQFLSAKNPAHLFQHTIGMIIQAIGTQ